LTAFSFNASAALLTIGVATLAALRTPSAQRASEWSAITTPNADALAR
jgi:hypothetical protein